ncbi:hypothetical protein RHS01_06745 [Rhizoctonia solani]|uniref:Uncharacterized protein n=1 Tax=Rhizoctonia solani TaxID=456999 RepID=A0A8H7ICY8_9AGAM|nr:hypothetical protein RHS01_06745 [Rhizoctonia solani]
MPGRHPCERGRWCSCHRAGPSTIPTPPLPSATKKKKKYTLLATTASLVCPVLGAPTPQPTTHLPFLYPTLDKRVTDAGQAPDDPSEGFQQQHIQLADLIRAGLPYKFVYDPVADTTSNKAEDIALTDSSGAWVIDNSWSLHGRRFGPLYATATATAGITDDPLPTPTESVPPASTPTATTTPPPTILAIESSLRLAGNHSGDNDADSAREKVAQSSLVSRVGRALQLRNQPPEEEEQQQEPSDPRLSSNSASKLGPDAMLPGEPRPASACEDGWDVDASVSVYFYSIFPGLNPRFVTLISSYRYQADSGPDTPMGGAIQEEPEPDEEGPASTRATSPVAILPSRASSPTAPDSQPPTSSPQVPAPNYASPTVPNYPSPTVPTYSPPPTAGPSTSPLARIEAHPMPHPLTNQPMMDQAREKVFRLRTEVLPQVARGKRPAHSASPRHPSTNPIPNPKRLRKNREEHHGPRSDRRQACARTPPFDERCTRGGGRRKGGGTGTERGGRVWLELGSFDARWVPADFVDRNLHFAAVSRNGVAPMTSMAINEPASTNPNAPALPLHRRKLEQARWRVCRRGDHGDWNGNGKMVPSAPPCDEETVPSAPALEHDSPVPSAPSLEDEGLEDGERKTAPAPNVPSAPPLDDDPGPSTPLDDRSSRSISFAPPSIPSALLVASAPVLHDDAPSLDGNKLPHPRSTLSHPELTRNGSSAPLFNNGEER